MDRPTDQPLSVREAKDRLRSTAEEALPAGYVKRHPYTALGFALATGYFFGKIPAVRSLFTSPVLGTLWAVNQFIWQSSRNARRTGRS